MPIYSYVSTISAWTRIKDIQADAEMPGLSIYCANTENSIQYNAETARGLLTSNICSDTIILGITKTVSGSPFNG